MRKIGWAMVFSLFGPGFAWAEVTIAALGDSLTQGYGLPQAQGLVPQLQSWLRGAGADATLVNAGVSGDTTAGGAARIGWTLTPETDGLIVALGANDLLRGIDPTVARANLDRILNAANTAGVPVMLIGFPAPLNYGADYKQAFDQIYPELAAEYDALCVENFFAGLSAKGDTPSALRQFLQPDGLHPNAEGVALIVEGLGPHVLELIGRIGG